jgi:hypothetical protein
LSIATSWRLLWRLCFLFFFSIPILWNHDAIGKDLLLSCQFSCDKVGEACSFFRIWFRRTLVFLSVVCPT